MECLLGLRHCLVGESFRGARALDGRPRVCLHEHPQRSGTECITTSQDEEGVEHANTTSTYSAPPPSSLVSDEATSTQVVHGGPGELPSQCAYCAGAVFGLLAHEEYETPSTTWIESDSESAPPPSPVHDAPEDQGAIILPPSG